MSLYRRARPRRLPARRASRPAVPSPAALPPAHPCLWPGAGAALKGEGPAPSSPAVPATGSTELGKPRVPGGAAADRPWWGKEALPGIRGVRADHLSRTGSAPKPWVPPVEVRAPADRDRLGGPRPPPASGQGGHEHALDLWARGGSGTPWGSGSVKGDRGKPEQKPRSPSVPQEKRETMEDGDVERGLVCLGNGSTTRWIPVLVSVGDPFLRHTLTRGTVLSGSGHRDLRKKHGGGTGREVETPRRVETPEGWWFPSGQPGRDRGKKKVNSEFWEKQEFGNNQTNTCSPDRRDPSPDCLLCLSRTRSVH